MRHRPSLSSECLHSSHFLLGLGLGLRIPSRSERGIKETESKGQNNAKPTCGRDACGLIHDVVGYNCHDFQNLWRREKKQRKEKSQSVNFSVCSVC